MFRTILLPVDFEINRNGCEKGPRIIRSRVNGNSSISCSKTGDAMEFNLGKGYFSS